MPRGEGRLKAPFSACRLGWGRGAHTSSFPPGLAPAGGGTHRAVLLGGVGPRGTLAVHQPLPDRLLFFFWRLFRVSAFTLGDLSPWLSGTPGDLLSGQRLRGLRAPLPALVRTLTVLPGNICAFDSYLLL